MVELWWKILPLSPCTEREGHLWGKNCGESGLRDLWDYELGMGPQQRFRGGPDWIQTKDFSSWKTKAKAWSASPWEAVVETKGKNKMYSEENGAENSSQPREAQDLPWSAQLSKFCICFYLLEPLECSALWWPWYLTAQHPFSTCKWA